MSSTENHHLAVSSSYPDFLISYTDGKVGLFEIKQGSTAESQDTTLKANTLPGYIAREGEGE